jgi:prepilin-type N-terminal cleavage/methylation domain-containing protein/prepilin-type processing-associated H-X9-DG protein
MQRRGVTLIELLAVIAILVVMLALMLPGLAGSREAARRVQCVNNLKQLSLGIMNYHLAHGALPPIGDAAGHDLGMKPRLMTFLDGQRDPPFNGLNFSQAPDAPAHFSVRTTRINYFVCPSDRSVPVGKATLGSASAQIGYTSYPNNIGTYLQNHGGKFDGPAYELGGGVRGEPVTFKTITDGTSSTVIFSEWLLGRNDAALASTVIYRSSDNDTGPVDVATLAANCNTATAVASDSKGADWLDPSCGRGGGYSHVMPPKSQSCFFSNADFNKYATMIAAGSKHPGGVNVAFLDGSVLLIKTSIAAPVWQALGTSAGGELISGDSY